MLECTEPLAFVAASTDGLLPVTTQLPLYKPFVPFFEGMFGFATKAEDATSASARLETFLLSERVQSRTGDDLTLVLLVRRP